MKFNDQNQFIATTSPLATRNVDLKGKRIFAQCRMLPPRNTRNFNRTVWKIYKTRNPAKAIFPMKMCPLKERVKSSPNATHRSKKGYRWIICTENL